MGRERLTLRLLWPKISFSIFLRATLRKDCLWDVCPSHCRKLGGRSEWFWSLSSCEINCKTFVESFHVRYLLELIDPQTDDPIWLTFFSKCPRITLRPPPLPPPLQKKTLKTAQWKHFWNKVSLVIKINLTEVYTSTRIRIHSSEIASFPLLPSNVGTDEVREIRDGRWSWQMTSFDSFFSLLILRDSDSERIKGKALQSVIPIHFRHRLGREGNLKFSGSSMGMTESGLASCKFGAFRLSLLPRESAELTISLPARQGTHKSYLHKKCKRKGGTTGKGRRPRLGGLWLWEKRRGRNQNHFLNATGNGGTWTDTNLSPLASSLEKVRKEQKDIPHSWNEGESHNCPFQEGWIGHANPPPSKYYKPKHW